MEKVLGRTGAALRRAPIALAASSVVLALLFAGCGGGSGSKAPSASTGADGTGNGNATGTGSADASSSSQSTSGGASTAPGSNFALGGGVTGDSKVAAVANVAGVPIARSSYKHWLSVETALHDAGSPSHQALGFLITSRWMLDEAAARGIHVSANEVRHRFQQVVHQSYPKSGSLHSFIVSSHQTEADLLGRIEVELLRARIAAKLTSGQSSSKRTATLSSFEKSFHESWKHKTTCKSDYVMEDCSEYKGSGEDLTASASTPRAGKSRPNGEVYSAPQAFSISSSAFELNGEIPTQYTCAGVGVSPPLSWQKVPSKAVELVLFVIDDTSNGSNGGVRWVVGGIDPSSPGVSAGQTPSGGIVGTSSTGKAAYSPICPAHGKSDTIEIVMYALSKKIPLSSGFQPSIAESEYGKDKGIISSAITYAVASRP